MNKLLWKDILKGKQKLFFIYEPVLLLAGALLSVYPIRFMEKVIDAAVYREENAVRDILCFGGIYLLLQVLRACIIAFSDFLAKRKQSEITYSLQLYLLLYWAFTLFLR